MRANQLAVKLTAPTTGRRRHAYKDGATKKIQSEPIILSLLAWATESHDIRYWNLSTGFGCLEQIEQAQVFQIGSPYCSCTPSLGTATYSDEFRKTNYWGYNTPVMEMFDKFSWWINIQS
jgi:hypothetical protein